MHEGAIVPNRLGVGTVRLTAHRRGEGESPKPEIRNPKAEGVH
jgi:hypothetical protein